MMSILYIAQYIFISKKHFIKFGKLEKKSKNYKNLSSKQNSDCKFNIYKIIKFYFN